jgi:phosphoribosylformimino-5-aminoimidazole carboxamide ribonucleotide (ProFAR) isomerase
MKKAPNLQLLKKIFNIPSLKVIIDPGIQSTADIEIYSNLKIHKLILGLETISDPKIFTDCIRIFGSERTIVSIDMFNEVIQTKIEKYHNLSLIDIVQNIEAFGIKEIILLDLYKVGQKSGGIPLIYKNIRDSFKGQVIVGGGIKDFKNVSDYYNNNFSGVLIGTALHDGSIPIDKIREYW